MIGQIIDSLGTAAIVFFVLLIGEPIIRWLMRMFGFYAVVQEGTSHVYVLFGKVVAVLEEPGLYLLWLKMGPAALIVNWLGSRRILDMRLDQKYLRSLPVNSEEGAPMGIGVWYEMKVSDPVAYLFKNTDPRGSLAANVSNATVRTLSNMPLEAMLETRHTMSRAVRAEVSPKSEEWGYKLGSVYIRKVHFRDVGMIRQIEEKVVNRLRQVTSAIRQDGANRVSIITNSAERRAAVEFAKAHAVRPQIVGEALNQINADPEIAKIMFEILETENLIKSDVKITMLPKGNGLVKELLAAEAAKDNSSR
ncbi:MAG: SPFH/Band 7/PHB domain protein [Ardenticatenaceae bacterium]|nr:SPFH/Band 7/PHB domain protein [Ardenticatenaceae bacterium]